jgi:predicted RNA-binding Zn-ribbon protein involved in translation (DUF1610 family)
MVRVALRHEFGAVKFGVRSHTYAGGASIDVDWTDGPTDAAVHAVTSLYQGATFDGMTDMKSYHSALLAGPDGMPQEVHFGADFIFTRRDLSAEFVASCAELCTLNGRNDRSTQCESCGNWMPAGDCWVAPVMDSRGVRFVCTPECGGKVIARSIPAESVSR